MIIDRALHALRLPAGASVRSVALVEDRHGLLVVVHVQADCGELLH